MNASEISIAGERLVALGSGALWWPARKFLCLSDLHLGKSGRMARRSGAALPPYENQDTLARLAAETDRTGAATILCLGDSFDDAQAARDLAHNDRMWISRLQSGRRWIWIAGNHDPGPIELGGEHLAELAEGPLVFRHIARPGSTGEISGHYHPKARVRTRARSIVRAAFLVDRDRVVMPAFGTYTGGLYSDAPVLSQLMRPDATAILTGRQVHRVAMPR